MMENRPAGNADGRSVVDVFFHVADNFRQRPGTSFEVLGRNSGGV
jgi:hypothetical protein